MRQSSGKFTATEFCLVEPFKFEAREGVIDSVPRGFLLLKPVVAGICGSEMLYFKGEKERWKLEKRLPMCLLHEGVARIVESGERTRLSPGTHVVVNPMIPCKKCVACKSSEENLCEASKYMAATADGLARTLFLYPEEATLIVPQEVPLELAALTEPISIALNALEESQAQKDCLAAIIGDGPVGYLLALVASYVAEVSRENLYFVGVVDQKLALANDFATTVNSLKEKGAMARLRERFDVVFEAAGGKAQMVTIDQAIDLLRPGGRCVLLGLSSGRVSVEMAKIVNKGLTIKGSTRSKSDHYTKVLELLRNGEFAERVRRTISEKKFTIRTAEDLEEAFRYADTEEGEARMKPGRVLVYFP